MKKILFLLLLSTNIYATSIDKDITTILRKTNSCNMGVLVREIQNYNSKYRVSKIIRDKRKYILFIKDRKQNKEYLYLIKKC